MAQAPASASRSSDTPASRPLAGRHALVTGASHGIGAAIARELARLGADLTLVARQAATLHSAANALRHDGNKVRECRADVADAASLEALIDETPPVHILVNNAGGAETAPFSRTDEALWRRMLDLNLTSVYRLTHGLAPAMVKSGWGRIVNVASTAGLKGYAYVSAYTAAKHGVVGLTRALALELATSGVTVNAVCPGYTDTPMLEGAIATIAAKTKKSHDDAKAALAASNPMGRLVTPEEVASAVGWLCLPDSGSITGQAIAIAGGEL
ncbi:MAG: SDR family oxidoreductase [Alphaproteobacteria bacterium]|nr:SDR family oxidoreductase [Alphaproteobacteria bacterium]